MRSISLTLQAQSLQTCVETNGARFQRASLPPVISSAKMGTLPSVRTQGNNPLDHLTDIA